MHTVHTEGRCDISSQGGAGKKRPPVKGAKVSQGCSMPRLFWGPLVRLFGGGGSRLRGGE
jgi:hypothetical protein